LEDYPQILSKPACFTISVEVGREADTWFTYFVGMEGWCCVILRSTDSHPS